MANSEGQPNPDAAIVEAALEKVPTPRSVHLFVWNAVHREGQTAHQIADQLEAWHPTFAQALREGIAARRGQRFGGHGGRG